MQGTRVTAGFGGFDRSPDGSGASQGSLVYLSGTHAQALNDRWSFKLSGGGYSQDALPRPTGIIPGSPGTPYPPFANAGTRQPKFDGRLDYDFSHGPRLSFSGGVAGTEGIMHSGIGPFDIDSETWLGYAKASYSRGGLRANVFTNVLNPRADVERKDEFRETRVGKGATIGANATIICGNELGEYCLIAAGAVVTKPVVPHALMAGVPARRIGWVSRAGEILDESLVCPRTGERYELVEDRLRLIA
jgi:hypothetical protein